MRFRLPFGRRWLELERQPISCVRMHTRPMGKPKLTEKLLLVVQELLASLCSVFNILAFDNLQRASGLAHASGKVKKVTNSVDGAGFLAEATVDALGHVNVIACCSSCNAGSAGGVLITVRPGYTTHERRPLGSQTQW